MMVAAMVILDKNAVNIEQIGAAKSLGFATQSALINGTQDLMTN